MKSKIAIIVIGSLLLFGVSCKTYKTVKVPCRKCETDSKYFRAPASGISQRLNQSEVEAKANARTEIARVIQIDVQAVYEGYVKEYGKGLVEDYSDIVEQLSMQVANQTLRNLNYPCIESRQDKKTKHYETFVCAEMAKEMDEFFNNAYNTLSKDEKLNIEFDREKFRKVWDEEMNKYKEEHK